MYKSKWLAILRQAAAAVAPSQLRLVCFPYAGGGPGVFRSWARLLPKEVETLCAHLPGREARMLDAPESDPGLIVKRLAAAVSELPVLPTLFVVHSLGALLAYEVAFRLRQAGSPHTPGKVILSGCSPLHVETHRDEGPVWLLPEEEFVERLRELNGTPEEVLMNGLLQQAKRAARGFCTTRNFIAIAYLRMSRLKHLPAHPFAPEPA